MEQIMIDCPYCNEDVFNPVYKSETTTCITCNSCGKELSVTGECDWKYSVNKIGC